MNLKCLIIEDSECFGDILYCAGLEKNLDCTWVKCIEDAIQMIKTVQYDLFLCDAHVAACKDVTVSFQKTGLDLVRVIRRHQNPNSVVFVSTGLELLKEQDVLDLGADIFAYKPISEGISVMYERLIQLYMERVSGLGQKP
jgi:DNA-binding response OmpR family regulator